MRFCSGVLTCILLPSFGVCRYKLFISGACKYKPLNPESLYCHAKVGGNSGQWYERNRAGNWIAVRMDRNGRREMRNLIVNADDLGWTHGVNRGIAEAHRNGIVTSASLIANGCAFEAGVQTASESPRLGVGVHLNLSDGKPVAPAEKVKSLLDENGDFSGGPEALLFRLTAKSLET